MTEPVLGRAPSLSWCSTIYRPRPLGDPIAASTNGRRLRVKKILFSRLCWLNPPPPRADKRQDSSIACSSRRRGPQPTCPTQIGWLATEGTKRP